jgi:hypothetical protein
MLRLFLLALVRVGHRKLAQTKLRFVALTDNIQETKETLDLGIIIARLRRGV